jgi:hypothetical protein
MYIKDKRKQYYLSNKDKILTNSKQYYHDNRLDDFNIIMII